MKEVKVNEFIGI